VISGFGAPKRKSRALLEMLLLSRDTLTDTETIENITTDDDIFPSLLAA
jgi:hypothetical protein